MSIYYLYKMMIDTKFFDVLTSSQIHHPLKKLVRTRRRGGEGRGGEGRGGEGRGGEDVG